MLPVEKLTNQMILSFMQDNKELDTPAKKFREFIGGDSVSIDALKQWVGKVIATHLSIPSTGLRLCKWILAVMCFRPTKCLCQVQGAQCIDKAQRTDHYNDQAHPPIPRANQC